MTFEEMTSMGYEELEEMKKKKQEALNLSAQASFESGASKQALTVDDIRKMSTEEIMKRIDEVRKVIGGEA